MKSLSNKELNVLVGNVLAKQVIQSRKQLNAVQSAVMVRISNALAIEESCAALRSNEAGK